MPYNSNFEYDPFIPRTDEVRGPLAESSAPRGWQFSASQAQLRFAQRGRGLDAIAPCPVHQNSPALGSKPHGSSVWRKRSQPAQRWLIRRTSMSSAASTRSTQTATSISSVAHHLLGPVSRRLATVKASMRGLEVESLIASMTAGHARISTRQVRLPTAQSGVWLQADGSAPQIAATHLPTHQLH